MATYNLRRFAHADGLKAIAREHLLALLKPHKPYFDGRLFARENEPVVLNGRWVAHPKYGRQFEVEGMEYDLDLDADGLANHPEMKGIGPVKARLIAKRFGHDFDRIITDDPGQIAEAARLSPDAV